MSRLFHFKGILTENGWLQNVQISVNEFGVIESISPNQAQNPQGFALPGFQNAHSHAFQYAMAGLAEYHKGATDPDDFWSWRTAMYDLALSISPDQLEAIATMLYTEMVRHGYTSVAEFHYLHHDKNGGAFSNLAEMGSRLIAAAKTAGIRITLIPMFYQQGNFGKNPELKQRRFISASIDDYYRLLESTEACCRYYSGASVGLGIHSLRAVKPHDVIALTDALHGSRPFHIHIAEQLKEIDDCVAFHGKRPVRWLLDNCPVDEHFHLVHATHLDDNEVVGIVESGAHVVLCPSTEGNLGDGLFRFADFKKLCGKWSIGTDSHIGINPFEELRILDYGQRLISHKRNTFFDLENGDSGFNALKMAWQSGRKAMGARPTSFFQVGQPFDALVMKDDTALIACSSLKNLCNTFVYASDTSQIEGSIIQGNWITTDGVHLRSEEATASFILIMNALKTRR